MKWKLGAFLSFMAGWFLLTLGLAGLTTCWTWALSGGVLFLLVGVVLSLLLASEAREQADTATPSERRRKRA